MPALSRLSSSTYWIPPSRRLSAMNSTGTSSSSGHSEDSVPRNYVDPWDLENYAYLRRHCELDDSDPVVSLSTNGLDSAHSDFYFIPARQPLTPVPPTQRAVVRPVRRPSLMVGPVPEEALVDDEDFYNHRCCHHRPRRHSVAPSCHQHLLSVHPGLCEKAKPPRQLASAKEPPPLVYVYQTPRQQRKASRQIREYIPPISTSSEENEELYDELISSLARQRRQQQPQHFGLSTFGHLKIDYSCNWHNLDRYIAHT